LQKIKLTDVVLTIQPSVVVSKEKAGGAG